LQTLTRHLDSIRGVALSRDGRVLVSASDDKTLKIWEIEGGRERRTLTGHRNSVYGVALSGDGRIVVSASYDQTIKVWALETGDVLTTFTCDDAVNCAHFLTLST
jgi:WD40 repeat protein